MANQWEVVGKPSRKAKTTNNISNKQMKKSFTENMPRIEVNAPVKESETIYDAFREKPATVGKDQVKTDVSLSPGKKAAQQNQQKKPNKKGDNKKKTKPPTLKEAIANIQYSEVERVLERDQVSFPDCPDVWLKDIASIINLRLDKVPEDDPVFEGKPTDYPACLLDAKLHKLVVNTIKICSDGVLAHFLTHCVASMVNDISKSISTYGYRICIQILAHKRPDIIIGSLKKQAELIQSNHNRPLRCLSVMWALGQAGNNSLANGLKVWLEVMRPSLSTNNRALWPYAVNYLHALFSTHRDLRPAYGTINIQDFFPLQDLIIGGSSGVSQILNKKLISLYPSIKRIAYGSHPEQTLRLMFPSFLARASPNTSHAMKAEVLDCLTECLQMDRQCFSVWRQMYTKRLCESAVLLQHLLRSNVVRSKLDQRLLRETVQAFSITNEDLSGKSQGAGDYNKQCAPLCKDLLQQLNASRFPWGKLLFIIFMAFSAIIAYDISTHGSFEKSKTSEVLTETGVYNFSQQIWARSVLYTEMSQLWLNETAPVYMSLASEYLSQAYTTSLPYVILAKDKTYEAAVSLEEVTRPQRAWLYERCVLMLEWMERQRPYVQETVGVYVVEAQKFIGHWAPIIWEEFMVWATLAWQHAYFYMQIAGIWLQENVFTGSMSVENIQKTLSASLVSAQRHSSALIQYCLQLVSGPTTNS